MKTVYRVLAYAIAALVAVQAAAIGYAVFAQLHFIEGGGTLDGATIESAPGTGAFIFHALNGARRLARGARDADHLVLREDSAGRQVGGDRPGVYGRSDRLGHFVASRGRDRGGAWCGRAGPLRSRRDGSYAGTEAGRRRGAGTSRRRLTGRSQAMASRSTRTRVVISVLATIVILAPLAWLWQSSLVGKSYSVMGMGTLDYGGGPVVGHDHGSTDRSITDLVVDDARKADVRVDLVAEQQNLTIGGRSVPGYTLNGTSPGPTITAHQGELVEVHVRNASVKAGITLHWHGYDVPAAMDGVAGVTQDEVPIGSEFIYRFVANQVGTYWYHSHQVSMRR